MSEPIPAEPPLAVFDVKETMLLSSQPARLLIYADRLVFEAPGQLDCELLHAEQADNSRLIPFTETLVVEKTPRRTFVLGRDAFRAVEGWIGPLTMDDLKAALKRRLAWITPIGLMLVVLGLPLAGAEFDPLLCIEGMGLVFIGQAARVRPHRLFFLIDAGWFLLVAVTTILAILADGSWWWLFLVGLHIIMVITGIQEYQHFAPARMLAEPIDPSAHPPLDSP